MLRPSIMKLPPQLPKPLQARILIVRAYDLCLNLEQDIEEQIDLTNKGPERSLILCRILGYLLHHIPTDKGLETLALEINACGGDRESILRLGEIYLDYFIRPFWSDPQRGPFSPDIDSQHSFANVVDVVDELIDDDVPQNHIIAKTHALFRDSFQCAITKTYDAWAIVSIQEIKDNYLQNSPKCQWIPCYTRCAHILPESIYMDIPRDSKNKCTTSIWDILESFGYDAYGIQEKLKGPKIFQLENAITMRPDMHEYFKKLVIWFTPTEEANKYNLEIAPFFPSASHMFPKFVTLTTPNQDKFPCPSPVYLAIHAICAKVASFSGAFEYIKEFLSDVEELDSSEDDEDM